MMIEEHREQFENEQMLGKKAKAAYEAYIKDFCQLKRESLFMVFSELPLGATEELMNVKRMLFAIDTLENDILLQMETGHLATVSLTEAQPKANEVN